MEFDLESQTEEEIWFVLKDTESTLEKYPFHFILKVGYRLSGRQVEVMWKVENPNDKKMYFSIGGHPAFNCPLKEGEKQEDCQLVFDTEGPLTSSILTVSYTHLSFTTSPAIISPTTDGTNATLPGISLLSARSRA